MATTTTPNIQYTDEGLSANENVSRTRSLFGVKSTAIWIVRCRLNTFQEASTVDKSIATNANPLIKGRSYRTKVRRKTSDVGTILFVHRELI